MNSKHINFFPTLENVEGLNVETKYSFFFNKNGETIDIATFEDEKFVYFDEKTEWNCDDYDLLANVTLTIANCDVLFGFRGVASTNAKLKICVEWYSAQSKQREVITTGEIIRRGNKRAIIEFKGIKFPKKTLIGNVTVKVLLYLYEAAEEVTPFETHLNNEAGVILGTLDEKVLCVIGNGSLFPIKVEALDSNRLWQININYDDPEDTELSSGVVLILNSNHKDYKLVDPNTSAYCERLTDEIVSSAISILLCKLKEEGYIKDLESYYQAGTIMEFVRYCKNTLEIDFTDTYSICDSVRKVMEA